MVRAAEACGSRSGETSHDVIIGDAGVLPPAASSASSAGAQPLHRRSIKCKLLMKEQRCHRSDNVRRDWHMLSHDVSSAAHHKPLRRMFWGPAVQALAK